MRDEHSNGHAEIAALAQQVATARGKLPLQYDDALLDVLSDSEVAAERDLAEWIRAQRRGQRRRAVQAELAAEKRDRRAEAALRRAEESDARWHRKALAARRRVASRDARIAQLFRRAEWSSRALIAVVVLGMVWAGVNVQRNLVPSGDMTDPLYWLSYGIEAMISIPIIIIMIAATTAARWGRELPRGKVVLVELLLLGTTIGLNAGPHLAAGDYGRAAEFAVAPIMVGVVIWLHAWVSARYAQLIEEASQTLDDAGSDPGFLDAGVHPEAGPAWHAADRSPPRYTEAAFIHPAVSAQPSGRARSPEACIVAAGRPAVPAPTAHADSDITAPAHRDGTAHHAEPDNSATTRIGTSRPAGAPASAVTAQPTPYQPAGHPHHPASPGPAPRTDAAHPQGIDRTEHITRNAAPTDHVPGAEHAAAEGSRATVPTAPASERPRAARQTSSELGTDPSQPIVPVPPAQAEASGPPAEAEPAPETARPRRETTRAAADAHIPSTDDTGREPNAERRDEDDDPTPPTRTQPAHLRAITPEQPENQLTPALAPIDIDTPIPGHDPVIESDEAGAWAAAKTIVARGWSKVPVEQLAEILEMADRSRTPASIGAEMGLPRSVVDQAMQAARKLSRTYAMTS